MLGGDLIPDSWGKFDNFSENRVFLINFDKIWGFVRNGRRFRYFERKVVQKWYFYKFGSKSLKSDNLTFFRILRIIEKNEGVSFR